MIVATAGHVDHGKTTLIKALTGVETDRLSEEKRRGMTIDLGFAYLPMPALADGTAEPIGFIDVPGHQGFIRNMLCGIGGTDFALLVIAADDGPRPQTLEHLAILDLLDIRLGAVVLTKIDRVSPERLACARAEVNTLLLGTTLATAPMFQVAAPSGAGIEDLKKHLVKVAAAFPPRVVAGNFRLALDRCFNLTGAGLIVTGTVFSGAFAVGEQVRALGSGASVRVRSIHAQNQPVAGGKAGQRCAVNLVGLTLKSEDLLRGEWIVAGDAPLAQRKMDARLRILAGEARPFAHWTPVHIHLGAAHTTGRIALVDGKAIEPGHSALVQLVLERPIGAAHADRFIVRDQSAHRTIGGGRVIDIFPPARVRSKPDRLAELAATETPDSAAALAGLLDRAEGGVQLHAFAANRNLTQDEAAILFTQVPMVAASTAGGPIAFSTTRWAELRSSVLAVLAAWHVRSPSMLGPPADRILQGSQHRLSRETIIGLACGLAREGAIVKSGIGVHLASHKPSLDTADEILWQQIEPLLRAGGLRPPSVSELSYVLGGGVKRIEVTIGRAAHCGRAIRVSQRHCFLPEFVLALAEIVQAVARQNQSGTVTAAAVRDKAGIGRNLSVDVLEFFDKVRFTRRGGDARILNCAASDIFSGNASSKN